MKLNLINTREKRKKKMRVGRGIGSGKGKTSGRGHKGQKSRSGVAIKSFEGGQMPLYRRLPKRGFKSLNQSKKKLIAVLNLSKIQHFISKKSTLTSAKINLLTLQKSNLLNKKFKKLKVLSTGEIKEKFDLEVNFISSLAKEKIEKSGGKVSLIK